MPEPRPDSIEILGVPISTEARSAILERCREWLTERAPHHIVTVNPEILVAGHRNHAYRTILMSADLCLADGGGVLLLARLTGQPAPTRLPGVELIDELAELASTVGRSVYLVGAGAGVAAGAAATLQVRHPALRIAGAEEGIPKLTDERFQALDPMMEESRVVERIAAAKPGVLFVAYGHPKQEQFIAEHKRELGASILVGVGGSFDFLANRVPRAPKFLQVLWLEWLWRLILEPARLGRILTATLVFPWLALRDHFSDHRST